MATSEDHVGGRKRLRILILYDDNYTHVGTTRDHLDSFARYSAHAIYYQVASSGAPHDIVDWSAFDAVILHYCARAIFLPPAVTDRVSAFPGLRAMFIQDEYELTETTRRLMERMRVQVVFTSVPPAYREIVYPSARFPGVEFVPTLTGYASILAAPPPRPFAERPYFLGYRGRPLPFWYGDLGQEKAEIGRGMRRVCEARGVPCDIEWSEEARVYGGAWIEFIRSCRAVLGTESGSNVFDWDGELRRGIDAAIREDPSITYRQVFDRFLAPHEGRVKMNQVSARVFEAIALGTALVLFEGDYSGVVQPNVHYIPLKKDFSNANAVLERLEDVHGLERMTERAYADVIASGKYGYDAFIRDFDAVIERHVAGPKATPLIIAALGPPTTSPDRILIAGFLPSTHVHFGVPRPTRYLLARDLSIADLTLCLVHRVLDMLPSRMQQGLKALLRPAWRLAKEATLWLLRGRRADAAPQRWAGN